MSVVGPRPHMLKHTEEYTALIDGYMLRHEVKPGVTGWSQIKGFRGEIKQLKDMENRVKSDLWYIRNWHFLLDLYIILKTVTICFGNDKNAH
jgi:putative colanic acid biosynthesis UDP-glucose lipid carrier transferase